MKRYIFFILSILPLFVYAQNSVKAKEILDKTAMTLQKGAGIHATFHGTQSGTIIMDGEKFHLDCDGIKTWFDGKTQWSYVEENEEVNITEPTRDELMEINPYLLFQSYDKGYGYTEPLPGESFDDYVKRQDPELYNDMEERWNSLD